MASRTAQQHRKSQHTAHYSDFIRKFTEQEKASQRVQKPKALSAKERKALRRQLKDVQFLQPDFADGTKVNIAGVLRKWRKYCVDQELGPWKDAIMRLDKSVAMDFLDYMCERWDIKSQGSSWEYWRQLKQLYCSTTGRFLDRNDNREIKKWHDTVLVRKWTLREPNIDGKPVLGTDDLFILQNFNIAYDEGIFPTERHRIQLLGCYLLLAFTGCRPAEIVDNEKKKPQDGSWQELYGTNIVSQEGRGGDIPDDDMPNSVDACLLEDMLSQEAADRGRTKALCYEDICLFIVRHPETGIDVPAMAVKFSHHKGMDRKPKPTIFYFTGTRRLLFCIVTVVISLAIHDQAFDASWLTTVASVFKVRNTGGMLSTPLRWKEEWLKRPIFRGFDGSMVSRAKPLPYNKLSDDLERQTLDAGFEKALGPKAFRRGAANAANGTASDAVRDQVMRHDPKWATFNSAYINEKVEFHIEKVVADEPTEDCLIKLFTHMSITRDPSATQDMVPDEIRRQLAPCSDIMELERTRDQLKNGKYRVRGMEYEEEIRRLTQLIRTKRAKRDKALQQAYRKYYFYNRPTWEIERQLSGQVEEKKDAGSVAPRISLHIPERARLADLLCHQPDNLSFEKFCELRIQAAELMVALCDKKETAKRRQIRKVDQANIPIKQESPETDTFPLLMGKAQCPRCIGDESISMEERTFSYCRPWARDNHFDRHHLSTMKALEKDGLIFCHHPKCKDEGSKLKTYEHFRNHVERVHGINLRPPRL